MWWIETDGRGRYKGRTGEAREEEVRLHTKPPFSYLTLILDLKWGRINRYTETRPGKVESVKVDISHCHCGRDGQKFLLTNPVYTFVFTFTRLSTLSYNRHKHKLRVMRIREVCMCGEESRPSQMTSLSFGTKSGWRSWNYLAFSFVLLSTYPLPLLDWWH